METDGGDKMESDAQHTHAMLKEHFDAVVMLTWSDWATEMRSNRYHYASRFQNHLPVLFIQPDLPTMGFSFEDTEFSNLSVLHVYRRYGASQGALLAQALNSRRIVRPLLWIYNYLFDDFIMKYYAGLKVYHATEDYFSTDFLDASMNDHISRLRNVLQHTDLLISISEGVHEDYEVKGGYAGESAVVTNGCDYRFWNDIKTRHGRTSPKGVARTAFYEGGISRKIDFPLLQKLAGELPDWEFKFCGRVFLTKKESASFWKPLTSLRNVTYLGVLTPDELKRHMHDATVGLIPFVQNDWIRERSFPLKAFEYLACGLPVVSVPIRSLDPYRHLIAYAGTADEFREAILGAQDGSSMPDAVEIRKAAARQQDYDIKFTEVLDHIHESMRSRHPVEREPSPRANRLNILVLYDKDSTHVTTIREHLDSFATHSRHHVVYAHATKDAPCTCDLSVFDVVLIHYSVRLSLTSHLSPSYAERLKRYPGLKILFIQDEYDSTHTAWDWIRTLGIHIVYTCVPERYLDYVYPHRLFTHVEFIVNLTGFVPPGLEGGACTKPLKERPFFIGYRGRKLPYWYGTLGHEKYMIGVRMRQICEDRAVTCNIESDDNKRIYGDKWYEFISDCRAVLGTESGSNVFDFQGAIRKNIEEALRKNPGLTFEEIHRAYLQEPESHIQMNQISPRIFEAIALKTALVLFEGTYSGILQPHVHYIPLKKDFSNVDEVLERIHDLDYLERLTDQAMRDVIETGNYSYRRFIEGFDAVVSSRIPVGQRKRLISSVSAWKSDSDESIHVLVSPPGTMRKIRLELADCLLSRESTILRDPSRAYDRYLMLSDLVPPVIKRILSPLLLPLKKIKRRFF